jgi:hypothetical protein
MIIFIIVAITCIYENARTDIFTYTHISLYKLNYKFPCICTNVQVSALGKQIRYFFKNLIRSPTYYIKYSRLY